MHVPVCNHADYKIIYIMIFYGCVVQVLNYIYSRMAQQYTHEENHRTDTQVGIYFFCLLQSLIVLHLLLAKLRNDR